MKQVPISAFAAFFLAAFLTVSATAQQSSQVVSVDVCEGPVYRPSEVTRRANLTARRHPQLTAEALAHGVRGTVVLSAVLCQSGRVTDIKVIEELPYGVTEQVVAATRAAKFTPAEKDGRPVSQATKFVFHFGYIGERGPLARGPLAGRMIESVEIEGLRESLGPDKWKPLKTGGGRPYNERDIEHDWRVLLQLGDFDKQASTLRVEEGNRGGLVVVFLLKERPKP